MHCVCKMTLEEIELVSTAAAIATRRFPVWRCNGAMEIGTYMKRDLMLTSMILFNFSVRSMNSEVHARSLGLCPTPTARTRLPSRRASSSMSSHWRSLSGSKTAKGVHSYVRPQLMKDALGEVDGTVTGSKSWYNVWRDMLDSGGFCSSADMLQDASDW